MTPIRSAQSAGVVLLLTMMFARCVLSQDPANPPIQPTTNDGKPLNLDFEDGTLKDWTATGNAFEGQPVRGDAVAKRRKDSHRAHQGEYWIGAFEINADDAIGTLTSVPFKVTHPWASFLVGGGHWQQTRVELVSTADNKVFFTARGHDSETLQPVVVDLQKHAGKEIFIRVVDEKTGAWGHINFDDFVFYDHRPQFKDELKTEDNLLVGAAERFVQVSRRSAATGG